MELYVQELINLEDCSNFMVKKRQQAVKQALLRYKHGESTPEEMDMLIQAMRLYRGAAKEENQARAYNVLLYFYFADTPLVTSQMPMRLNVNKRTVFKDISRGVKELTVIMNGIGGLDLLPDAESSEFIKTKIQESLKMRLTEEIEQEVRSGCRSFFEEHPLMNITYESRAVFEIKAKQQRVREALKRYKQGNSTPGKREELMQAMERYKATSVNEKQDMAYNILFSFYFADYPLKAAQISDKYRINKRTVYKYITRGVEDLTNIMYGPGGICPNPNDESSAALRNTQVVN
ncbi:hypothetical protein [Syntrophomonas wolfei]|uniref:hypothetical protein n=1 Tax=Syntrophomonas wolfei TaxID=863 RepID=UPI0023EF5C2E|nr:hypothetical protein [Syntrophomonas wolfei]